MDQKINILVVDDERGLREGCRLILESEGYSVDLATNGNEGLALLQQKTYDLIIVDLMMPGMGGLEMMDEIKKLGMDIIIIVITGFATIETAVEAMKHGAYDYVPKPFEPDQLSTVVNRGLEKRRLQLQAKQLMEERDLRLLEIANEKSKIHTIINSMPDAVLVFNRDQQLVLWNPAALKMLNLNERLKSGKNIKEILSLQNLVEITSKALNPDSSQYTSITEEISLEKQEPKTIMANVSVVRDESTEILGVVSILRDITKLKEIDRVKSQFISMVAHELRAPLSAIESYLNAYLTDSAGDDPEFKQQMLNRAKKRAHSLLDMVNDLLHISHLESERIVRKKELLDISNIIFNTVELLKNQTSEHDIQLQSKIPETCPPIEADKSEIEQLFTNLISNAIKYNIEHGKVTISCATKNNFLSIRIADTGIGISEEDLSNIFDEFFRVSREETRYITGTGLGLAIVKKIVESHFGQIDVESTLNKGTTFIVKFPIKS